MNDFKVSFHADDESNIEIQFELDSDGINPQELLDEMSSELSEEGKKIFTLHGLRQIHIAVDGYNYDKLRSDKR